VGGAVIHPPYSFQPSLGGDHVSMSSQFRAGKKDDHHAEEKLKPDKGSIHLT
jgi:hypothetical protein